MKRKRAYSHEFPYPPRTVPPTLQTQYPRYLLDAIPPRTWKRVQAKAKRQGVSVRVIILRFLTSWVEAP